MYGDQAVLQVVAGWVYVGRGVGGAGQERGGVCAGIEKVGQGLGWGGQAAGQGGWVLGVGTGKVGLYELVCRQVQA